MLILAKIKAKWAGVLFTVILSSSFVMGIYATIPAPNQAGQVNIPLYSVIAIQRELVDRGHDIKVDGIFGKQTDYALTLELTKEIE
jgi:hypothetical protein